jgi:hypothetical protein
MIASTRTLPENDLVREKVLKVEKCTRPNSWYAGLVGKHVPYLGFIGEEWCSREPSGHKNFVRAEDAHVVYVPVCKTDLDFYPWKFGQPEPDGPEAGQVPTPAPWPAPPEPKARPKVTIGQRVDWPRGTGPAMGCKERCNLLGVCRGLPDCEGIPHPAPVPAAMGQSKRHSAIEATVNIVLGFGVSVAITAVLLPAMGHQVTLAENVAMTCVFTVASFVRAYGVRRAFNWWLLRAGRGRA